MCSLVTYTVQLNPSLHVYFISDKIVLKCVKTHDSRIQTAHFHRQLKNSNRVKFLYFAKQTGPNLNHL